MNRMTANAADLAADYKARGIDRQASYSFFVKDRDLRPEINAKDFFAIFDATTPALINDMPPSEKFVPTHWDTELEEYVQIRQDERGVYRLTWAGGHTGSNPPGFPMDKFIPIEEKE